MSQDTTTYDSTVTGMNSDSGMIHVPAQAQRDLGICIDDTVEVTLEDFGHEFVDRVSFENPQTAGDFVTVPARIMRKLGIEGGVSVTASFDTVDADDAEAEQSEAEAEDDGSELGELFG